jgi:hypothetical protein
MPWHELLCCYILTIPVAIASNGGGTAIFFPSTLNAIPLILFLSPLNAIPLVVQMCHSANRYPISAC